MGFPIVANKVHKTHYAFVSNNLFVTYALQLSECPIRHYQWYVLSKFGSYMSSHDSSERSTIYTNLAFHV